MKKLIFAFIALLAPCVSYGKTVDLGGVPKNSNYDLRGRAFPEYHNINTEWTIYYKCSQDSSAWFVPCGDVAGIKVTYGSVDSEHYGSQTDPYILNTCTKIECACDKGSHLLNGNACEKCPDGKQAISGDEPGLHTDTSCNFCVSTKWKNGDSCEKCPINATCDGEKFYCNVGYYKSGNECKECPKYDGNYFQGSLVRGTTKNKGANDITECFVRGGAYYDDIGQYETDDCSYKN